MNYKLALLMLALLFSACSHTSKPQPIPAVPQSRQCPSYPLPPAELIVPPSIPQLGHTTVPSSSTN